MELFGVLFAPINCIIWLALGAFAGSLARRIMNRPDQPLLNDIILGVIGAYVGGILVSFVGYNRPEGGLPALCVNFVVAIIGACALIALGSLFTRDDRRKVR
jgi:uncharacterized membrane protein YeaQ/YmgE (transglycosylase-associated protein family)